MPSYLVTSPSGKKLKLTGDSPPTESDLDEIFSNYEKNDAEQEQSTFESPIETAKRISPFGTPGELFIPGFQQKGSPVDLARRAGGRLGEIASEGFSEEPFELSKTVSKKIPGKIGELVSKISPKTLTRFGISTAFDPATLFGGPAVKAVGKDIVPSIGLMAKTGLKETASIPKNIYGGLKSIVSLPSRIEKKIGEEITPKAVDAILENSVKLTPEELSTVSKIPNLQERLNKGINLRVSNLKDTYKKVVEEIPEDFLINLRSFKGKIGRVLKREGVIDEFGNVVPGIGRDNRVIKGLSDIYSELKARTRLNLPSRIRKLISEKEIKLTPSSYLSKEGVIKSRKGAKGPIGEIFTGKVTPKSQRSLKEAARFTDTVDKPNWIRLKSNLEGLTTGDNKSDRLIYELIEDLDDSAIQSGAKNLKKAKLDYKLAKETESRFLNRLTGETKASFSASAIQEKLKKAQGLGSVQQRDDLRKLLGNKADDIIKSIEKNRTSKFLNRAVGGAAGLGLIDYLVRRIIGKAVLPNRE